MTHMLCVPVLTPSHACTPAHAQLLAGAAPGALLAAHQAAAAAHAAQQPKLPQKGQRNVLVGCLGVATARRELCKCAA
jgi:hypothetical protein